MPKAIFVNLVVADLKRAMDFFRALGFSFNAQFTNDQAAALVISDTIYAMLHVGASMRRFTKKELADPAKTLEAIYALQVESREEADAIADKALGAGGREPRGREDYGFMYSRSFEDPDGHFWEVFWMDPAHVEK